VDRKNFDGGFWMKTNWPEKVWVNSPVRLWVQKREMNFFKSLRDLPSKACCLEIGCGKGAAIPLIKRMYKADRVDAFDIDEQMAKLALERKSGLVLIADAQDIPYPDESMDAVFNFGIIHHLEDWERGIREIARVLKKSGSFFFEEIYPPLYANFLFKRILVHPRNNRFYGEGFRSALANSGLALQSGYVENRFRILGVAVKDRA
jgi:ubiquinone/menaquinone biosynthesis C-methylase UbiE